jgi:hypothetical protein
MMMQMMMFADNCDDDCIISYTNIIYIPFEIFCTKIHLTVIHQCFNLFYLLHVLILLFEIVRVYSFFGANDWDSVHRVFYFASKIVGRAM